MNPLRERYFSQDLTPNFKTVDISDSPDHRTPPKNDERKDRHSPAQSTAQGTTPSEQEWEWPSLKPAYHSARQAKYFALVLIQDLVKKYQCGVYPYCMMLEILNGLSFSGLADVGLKVAITVFYIGSKFFDSKGPRLQ
jgi:hypothetical protein